MGSDSSPHSTTANPIASPSIRRHRRHRFHATVVAALRDRFGLEKRPVKVHEPSSCSASSKTICSEAMGIDVRASRAPPSSASWFATGNPGGSGDSKCSSRGIQHHRRRERRHADLPEGDTTVSPSGRMPKGGYFFDSIIRQEPIDEERLNPEDNLEEFSQSTMSRPSTFCAACPRRAAASRLALSPACQRHRVRRHRPVPGPFEASQRAFATSPNGTFPPRARRDYIQHGVLPNSAISRSRTSKRSTRRWAATSTQSTFAAPISARKNPPSARPRLRRTLAALLPADQRMGPPEHSWKTFKHSCGSVIKMFDPLFMDADSISSIRCNARRPEWNPNI